MTAEPCRDCARQNLPYLSWHADAERRTKRGERQKKCKACGLYYWPALLRRRIKEAQQA